MIDTLAPAVHIGVGLDTARYGHYATFLDEKRQTAAPGLTVLESRQGYEQLAAVLARLSERQGGNVHFDIRIDAAGQYAVNLEAFLRKLPFAKTISIGEPKRNRDYKNAHFPKCKADPVDSLACARFAVVERPAATKETPSEFLALRELAGALQTQRKHTTRRVNQLHNHLARVFPELATLAPDLSAGWVLALLRDYPTPALVAAADPAALARLPHVDEKRAAKLQAAAQGTTGSLAGPQVGALIQHAAHEVWGSQQSEDRLQELLEKAFHALPAGPHRQILTIPGIGKRTAAAVVAKVVSIDRFDKPEALVSYFGAFPEQNTSGVDKFGRPVPNGTRHMSRKGNDLVRGLLWMACQSAIRFNPAIRALYARQKAAGKRGDVALGHCMRKMLHLIFAVWKTDRPFDPQHFAWESSTAQAATDGAAPASTPAQQDTAGHNGHSPERKVVTAASTRLATRNVPRDATGDNANPVVASGVAAVSVVAPKPPRVNFAELRRQVSLTDVLRAAGVLDRLQGRGAQRRGPCPIHAASATGRSLSVNLEKQVFRCLDPTCGVQGNVLDFWAALQKLPLREAAAHLATTFNISPTTNATQAPRRENS